MRFRRVIAILGVGVAIGVTVARLNGQRGDASRSDAAQPSGGGAQQASSPGGELWLCDFESDSELFKRWKTRQVVASRSEEHATHGRFAAKLIFQPATSPAFMMEDYLDSSRARRDWRKYDLLSFDLYNAESSQQRLILRIKDRKGRGYNEEVHVNGRSTQHVSVRLADVKDYLDLSYITQMNFFRWKPKRPATFYLDAVQLHHVATVAEAASADTAASTSTVTGIRPREQWQVAWTSGLVKVFRDPATFQGHATNPVQLALARGEYESAQLVLIGGSRPASVRVSVGALTQAGGSVSIPSSLIELRRVGYVTTKPPAYPVTFVGEWPDPLPPLKPEDTLDVAEGQAQPVWITVGAPEGLPAGRYDGVITVTDDAGRAESVALQVTVWDFTLPRTSHLTTAFDFYRGRMQKAYQSFVQGGEAWEGRMDELQRRYFLNMLKHRIFPMMSANPMGERFQRDIGLYLERGLGAFSVGSHGGSNGNNWPKEPLELERLMDWYRQAASSLRQQQLLDRAYIYTYDEPKPGNPRVAEIMAAIHRADPDLRNLVVMHEAPDPAQYAEWLKDADILCIRISGYDPAQAEQWRRLGKEVWIYISSPAHPFPAVVIDYPAMAHRILPWMTWKFGASGLLYWCVDFWTADPWLDPANFSKDQNGNGSLYYPTADGPVPSIRMEVLRDGVEDYEYLYRLKELLDAVKAKPGVDPALVAKAEQLVAVDPMLLDSLRSYSKDPELLLAQRRAIAEAIEKLQTVLGHGT